MMGVRGDDHDSRRKRRAASRAQEALAAVFRTVKETWAHRGRPPAGRRRRAAAWWRRAQRSLISRAGWQPTTNRAQLSLRARLGTLRRLCSPASASVSPRGPMAGKRAWPTTLFRRPLFAASAQQRPSGELRPVLPRLAGRVAAAPRGGRREGAEGGWRTRVAAGDTRRRRRAGRCRRWEGEAQ